MKFLRGQIDSTTYAQNIINKSVEYIAHKDEVITKLIKGLIKVLTNKYNLAPGISCW
jgi:hypothetical protein